MLNNNTISKKIIILGAISFWLFIFSGALIVVFHNFGFEIWLADRVGPKGTFWQNFYQPFSSVLMSVYNPFYLLPLFLAGYLASRWREKRKFYHSLTTIILPIFLSLLIAFPFFTLLSICAADSTECRKQLEIFMRALAINLTFCLVLSAIFNYRKEKIVKKLIVISLIFFLIIVGYIAFSAKIASGTGVAVEDLLQKAIEARDVSLCEKILEEGKERKTYSRNPGTILGGTYKKCIDAIALGLNDESVCDIYGKYNVDCHKEIFLKNTDLCKDVPQAEKVKCIQQIAIETNNIELCKKILGGVKCIAPIVAKTNNINLCFPEIINYPLPWEPNPFSCFEEVFHYTDNVDICNGIASEGYRNGCLSEATAHTVNPKLCEEVGENNYQYACYDGPNTSPHACLPDMDKSQCFIKFFRKTSNSQICQEITEGVNRDVCYYAAATELKNYNLCEQITEKTWKEWCRKDFGP